MQTAPDAIDRDAFPTFDARDIRAIEELATQKVYGDGESVFCAGQSDLDLYVVKSGLLEIQNPTDNNSVIITHTAGQFAGDIDLLTRRPVIVNAIARGERTELLVVPSSKLREVLNRVPHVGEKLITAITARRKLLQDTGVLGMRVAGPKSCRDTTVVREFLYKNFVPFTWYDTEEETGKAALREMKPEKSSTPVIECADVKKTKLYNPKLAELAQCAGIWRGCPEEPVDLAVIGAGPAGIAAAVYAASEGLKTVVIDRIGPGGQVGGSSMVENFIGFPAGLSGAELAQRGVIQMLKFGANMVAPVDVERLVPGKDGNSHDLHLSCGAVINAQVVFIATGMNWRKLDVPGAEPFERQGIYYACTSVESYLHQGHDVAVIGAGNSAGQAAMFLSERCARKVHMLIRKPELGPGMSEYLASRIKSTPNIEVHTDVQVSAVHPDPNHPHRLGGADLKHSDGRTSCINLSAIFVFIGAEPQVTWLPDTVARDSLGYLVTGPDALQSGRWPLKDRTPAALETTLPRVLAGGDVRAGSTKRVGFAVGDGSLAVTCVHKIRAGH